MTGEPELHPLTSEPVWVPYLAQLLNYQGYWHGSTSQGEFDEALRDAVIAFQTAQGDTPADGVVRTSTWQALTTATPITHAAPAGSSSSTPDAAQTHDAGQTHPAGQGMTSHPIETQQVPATMNVDGMPGARYTINSQPIAYAEFVTPAGQVELQLSLTGSGTVAFTHGLPVTITPDAISASVTQAVQGFSHGISVSGLPGENITITDSVNSTYIGASVSFDPATEAVVFHGEMHATFDTSTDSGAAQVKGSFGFNLTVRVHGGLQQEQEVPVQDTSTFFERHREALMIGGAIALLAVAVVIVVATDGAGAPAGEALGEEGLEMLGGTAAAQ